MRRRRFLASAAIGSGALLRPDALSAIEPLLRGIETASPQEAAQDEGFWLGVRQAAERGVAS